MRGTNLFWIAILKIILQEARKKSFIILVPIILIIAYFSFSLYLKMLGRDLVQNAIHTIQTAYPEVKSIQYGEIELSPTTFMSKTLTVHNINLTLNQSPLILHIDTLSVHNYLALKQHPFCSFDLNFKNLSLNAMQGVYDRLALWSNEPSLIDLLENIPLTVKLTASGSMGYDAGTQNLALNFNEIADGNPIFFYQTNLSPLPLSQSLLSNSTEILTALSHSVVLNAHDQVNVDETFSIAEVLNTFPLLGTFLQNLGYTNFPVHVNATSDYAGGENQQTFQADIDISEVGDLALKGTFDLNSPPSPYRFAYYMLYNAPPPIAVNPPSIAAATLVYTDESFMNHLFTSLAKTFNEAPMNIQANMHHILTAYADEMNNPALSSVIYEIAKFVANPRTLIMTFTPASPFRLEDIINFFNSQRQLNTILIHNVGALSTKQKAVLFNRYEAATSASYTAFFQRIGLNISANASS